MPRGVYDRSALKAKRSATKATKAANKAVVAAEMAITKSKAKADGPVTGYAQAQGGLSESYGSLGSDIVSLRTHLSHLVAAWEKIAGNTQGQHNPALLAVFDSEIIATVSSLKTWRESTFPSAEKKATAAPAAAPAAAPTKVAAPLSPPAPAPMPAQVQQGAAPAPLPFTPAAVQEVMKQAGQA